MENKYNIDLKDKSKQKKDFSVLLILFNNLYQKMIQLKCPNKYSTNFWELNH